MSEDLVNIEIDGRPLQARRGSMIIEVADANGIYIPRFCYHKKLSVAANCRMCLVQVEKVGKPVPACATPVGEGMKIQTRSAFARDAQRAVMEFLLINHPLDCPICDQGGECELQDVAMGFGREVSRYQEGKRVVQDEDIGPLIATDLTRCILCTRCVRFGEEVAGVRELGAIGRGERGEISTFIGRTVDSELSGNAIDLCPVGALTSKPFRFSARSWEMTSHAAIAPHDAVGSNLYVHVRRGQVLRVVPRENETVNETWISDRDRFSYLGLSADDRLTAPMVRRDGRWEAVDWEAALAIVVDGLKAAVARGGPGRIGALAAPSATLEELFLLQRLMRGLGSDHVDHRLREADSSDQSLAPLAPGLGVSFAELERVGAALLVGSNLRKDQPLLGHRLRKAALAGARVAVINPVDYPFTFPIDARVIADPAGMVEALAAVARALGASAEGPAATWVAGARPDDTHRAIARSLADASTAVVVLGDLALAHPQASLLRALARAVAAASGAVVGLLPAGANAAGAWLAGAVPHRQAGGAPVPRPGLSARQMLEEGLDAYLCLGLEPGLDCWDGHRARKALAAAPLTVALTAYASAEWQGLADVMLPIGAFLEGPGTYVNGEGLWQTAEAAVAPPGEARPAWKVLRVLGNLLDLPGFDYLSAGEVREAVRDAVGAGQAPEGGGRWDGPPAAAEPGEVVRVGELPIYAADPLVRRSGPLQQTRDAAPVARLAPGVAARIGLATGAFARVSQGDGEATLQIVVDERVAEGCAVIPAAVAATAGLGPVIGAVRVAKA
jgi:NADH-quinone oxidoreductase subunit G